MDSSRRDFTTAVLEVVETIPAGLVMTYGDVAAVLGSRAARAVGQVMARAGHSVPWWRVVRASGHPAQGHEDDALARLRAEGAPIIDTADGGRVNLRLARFEPR